MFLLFQGWIISLEKITPEHHQGSGPGSHQGNSYKVQHFTFTLTPFHKVLEIEKKIKVIQMLGKAPLHPQTLSVSKTLANKIFR